MTEAKETQASSATGNGLGMLRHPSMVAAAGALAGLVVGVVVGRASVSAPESSPQEQTAVERSEAHLSASPPDPQLQPEAPLTELRRALGRRPLSRREGSGFEKAELAKRPVARLSGEDSLSFSISAEPEDYVVTVVAHLEGAAPAKLEAQFDGQALPAATLGAGWAMYYTPVPRELLARYSHELSLNVTPEEAASRVSLDSVAVIPVDKTAKLDMGKGAVGNLIEGFAKPGDHSIWSEGPRSLVGIVLTSPAATDHRLKVVGNPATGTAPQRVTAKVNGTDVGVAEFARGRSEGSWTVPAKALRDGVNQIELVYSKTARPADHNPKSTDRRELALRFSQLELVPAQ